MPKKPSSDYLTFFYKNPAPSWICEKRTLRFVDANRAASNLLGFSRSELTKMSLNDIVSNGPFDLKAKPSHQIIFTSKYKDSIIVQLLCKTFTKTGKQYYLMVIPNKVIVPGKDGAEISEPMKEVVKLTNEALHADIEERLRKSVKEKEMLIKEIHHRVKNNLQIISSIIYLKMISLEQSDIRSFLDSLRQKIKSIALIHERLLQSERLDEVEIADYLGKLLADIQLSNYRQDLELAIEHDICNGLLPLDTAIYCGLILNELLTNSIKHAFQDRPKGKISVTLTKDEKKHLLLVKDNGVTLPEYIVPGKANSFGMQMIDVFVKQLNGSWRITRENGTSFLIRF